MERILNEEIELLQQDADKCGIPINVGRVSFENAVMQCKQILMDLADTGDVNAQWKLLELEKGHSENKEIRTFFHQALANNVLWVSPMKPYLEMYDV